MCTYYKSIEECSVAVCLSRKEIYIQRISFYGRLQFLFHFEYWGIKIQKDHKIPHDSVIVNVKKMNYIHFTYIESQYESFFFMAFFYFVKFYL